MHKFTTMLSAVALVALIGLDRARAEGDDSSSTTEQTMSDSPATDESLLQFTMDDIHGETMDLTQFQGKVVMFVNVASQCGNTPQYEGLETMYEKYKDQGLVIVGVPANNFKGQEPGTNEQILEFCTTQYAVTFPLLAKVSVKGEDTCELYQALIAASEPTGETGDVQWNFEKFLIGRDGKLIARFRPKVQPDDPKVVETVEEALSAD